MTIEKGVSTKVELSLVEQTELKGIADEIRYYSAKIAEYTFEVGKRLHRAREIHRHQGAGFQRWLADEFNESRTKAYKYIQFFEKCTDDKSGVPILGHLEGVSQTTLFSLSEDSVPSKVVSDAVERIRAGEKITTAEIKEMTEIHETLILGFAHERINLLWNQAAIEHGNEVMKIYEGYGETIFLKWLSAIEGMDDGQIIADIMNLSAAFKDASKETLSKSNLNELHAMMDKRYEPFNIPTKLYEDDDMDMKGKAWESFFSDLDVPDDGILPFTVPHHSIRVLWHCAILDICKELIEVEKIIGNRALNQWIQYSFCKSQRQADIFTDFISENKDAVMSWTPVDYEEEEAA